MATAQTGAIVITKGRMVSLAEFELRSKAWNTSTVPTVRTANDTASQAIVVSFIAEPTAALQAGLRNAAGRP